MTVDAAVWKYKHSIKTAVRDFVAFWDSVTEICSKSPGSGQSYGVIHYVECCCNNRNIRRSTPQCHSSTCNQDCRN